MRIAVLGAGSIGCLIAAKLVEAGHDVLVHARGEHGAVLALSGLNVSGVWDFQIQPNQWTVSLDEAGIHPSLEKSFDQSIITCKAKDTAKLAEIAAQITDGPVLSLQNGLGNHEILSRYVFENSAVGVTTNAVKRISPGQIEWVGRGSIAVGGPTGEQFIETLSMLDAEYNHDVSSIIWNKLLINVAINPLAAICGVMNGELLSEPLLSQAESTMLEAANVARLLGVEVAEDHILIQNLHSVLDSTAENECSMLADVKAGRETEIDVLCGQVVARGEKLGVPTPLNSMLLSQIKALR
ncbi:MAG TPA: 2-dehydropantoate 2-reductase [Candidatus Poseidoniales archaeon]|jgi:2-dehydropantoate 2-reductase|nr:MAG TPA: 2-dehydropantoate 2-reductase [Candidatus Poseidoniales archaeon]HIH57949.1 2-dehydropantoate 2-reductase [Candidatus Poseidoniaceae archaeon]|tara:strand:- start:106 stop:996 length:891 start_codon:yes stop_codon:yes gene_type:complete